MRRLGLLSVICCTGLVILSLAIGQSRYSSVISYVSGRAPNAYQLFLMDIDNDRTLQLTEPMIFCCPTWSPDGQKVIFANAYGAEGLRKRLYLMNANGSELRPLFSSSTPDSITAAWSPDGSLVAYVVMSTLTDFEIHIYDTRTGETRSLTQNDQEDNFPQWSPDGQFVVFRSQSPAGIRGLYRIRPDGSDLRQLTDLPNDSDSHAISPDSRRIAFISGDALHQDLFVMDADGGNLRQLTTTLAVEMTPFWSPDGRQILYRYQQNGSLLGDLYVIDAEGGDARVLMEDTRASGNLESYWSPDGSQILFVAEDASGTSDISVMDTGSGQVRRLTHGFEVEMYPAWRPGS